MKSRNYVLELSQMVGGAGLKKGFVFTFTFTFTFKKIIIMTVWYSTDKSFTKRTQIIIKGSRYYVHH